MMWQSRKLLWHDSKSSKYVAVSITDEKYFHALRHLSSGIFI